ncbi:MAG: DUF2252 domain-containing protein [Vulcanococcus sp.]
MPSASHASALPWWQAAAPSGERPDPIALLQAQDPDRFGWLVPVRYARMAADAFACFRGSAAVMTADLAALPHSGVEVQLCGDAHLLNFGYYASPERALLFDLNDFDETLRGPFEWDLRRLLASLVLATRQLGLPAERQERLARRSCRAYRKAMAGFAALPLQQLWSLRLDVDRAIAELERGPLRDQLRQVSRQARQRNSRQALRKLCERGADGRLRFRHDPPLLWTFSESPPALWGELALAPPTAEQPQPWRLFMDDTLLRYGQSLRDDLRQLYGQYHLLDAAVKAVGVGSVGTRCCIAVLQGPGGADDLLVLQSKQATRSVLEPYLGPSPYPHHGQRVVCGQRLMQSASDIFLGWTTTAVGAQVYLRHFRDWKWSVSLEDLDEEGLDAQARLCGWVLAKAHARSGDPRAVAAALAAGKVIDAGLAEAAVAYAEQAEADHRQLLAALASGRLPSDAQTGGAASSKSSD